MSDDRTKTTVDSKETEKSRDVSPPWWEHSGMQILKQMNVKIARYICEQLIKIGIANKNYENTQTPLRGLKVLDVGSGGGFLTEKLARTGCDLTGIDSNVQIVKFAKTNAAADATLEIKYLAESVEEYCKTHSEEYDVVVSNFVLQHVDDPKNFIECCSKCVKPGGSLFMSAIAKTYLAWFIQILLVDYVLRWVPRGGQQFNKFINASATENIIRSCGFKIEETQGFFYDVFTRQTYWVPIHSYEYITHAVKKQRKIS